MPVVSIFGSGTCASGSFEYDTAEFAGRLLGESGFDIATGGYKGVMEAALKGAASTRVRRIGIITEYYKDKETNKFVSEIIVSENYFERLKALVEIGDAYIFMPGGSGTLLELAYIWALKERAIIKNKLVLCLGNQWRDIIQTMQSYSNKSDEKSNMVEYMENVENVVERIHKHLVTLNRASTI
ncbi:LOG family protein [Bacteroidota bacterium]